MNFKSVKPLMASQYVIEKVSNLNMPLTLAIVCYNLRRMNVIELRKRLHDMCQDAGSIKAWSDANEISFGYVSAVIRGDIAPGNKILKAMGLRKAFSLKKTTVMKFEDIAN